MFINESFLSFVWQFSYFDLSGLSTAGGQKLEILAPGHLNMHAGPDFNDARIRIDGILWTGAVEIHVRSSQWFIHRHQDDANYNRVILHVVWSHDRPAFRQDGSEIPVLELCRRIPESLLHRFRSLVYVPADKIACQPQLDRIKPIKITGMIQKALIQRLERKSAAIDHLLLEYKNDWEEVSYQWVVRNFGFKVNQENMFLLAKFLPHKLILRHRNNILRLEALFFGMAGFLEEEKDDYQIRLKQEYIFLKHKYQLEGDFMKRYQWRFLRLHPQNFPTLRISQLAMFFTRINNFFSYVIQSHGIDRIYEDLNICQSFYWQHNYDFGVPSKRKLAGLGKFSIDNLLINSFAPLLVAYSRFTDQEIYQEKAITLLENISFENNRIIRYWKNAGIRILNAADSQGLIELYNQFCY
ncbi:MAG: DUF2851 family protein, partial [Cyclobacteriaceae bacterium]|nr:DUF2851 family protein [Cyclobacteriaceae bacterium]